MVFSDIRIAVNAHTDSPPLIAVNRRWFTPPFPFVTPAEFGGTVIYGRGEIYTPVNILYAVPPEIFITSPDEVLFEEVQWIHISFFHSHAHDGQNRAFQFLAAVAPDDASRGAVGNNKM
jgi:hypothetical protein